MELTREQISEGNEKLAKFLGWYQDDNIVTGSWYEKNESAIYVAYSTYDKPDNTLPFHRDWNYLMRVIDKIESLKYEVNILGGNLCMISANSLVELPNEILCTGTSKIIAVWSTVVKFIDLYNKKINKHGES